MSEALVSMERIRQAIILLRGQKVILDRDLAALYAVPTKALKQSVKRNAGRFPEDFMFVLTTQEFAQWRSQFVTSTADRKGLRHTPMAFTEQGVAMLSSVLNSDRAIRVNIAIMRAFVRLRETMTLRKELATRLADLERKIESNDEGIRTLFETIRQLMAPSEKGPRSIGFHVQETGLIYRVRRRRRRR